MAEVGDNSQKGGGGAAGIRIFFKLCPVGADFSRINLGCNPLHGPGPGGVPGPGGATVDRESPAETE